MTDRVKELWPELQWIQCNDLREKNRSNLGTGSSKKRSYN